MTAGLDQQTCLYVTSLANNIQICTLCCVINRIPKCDQLVNVALKLFQDNGFRAVGIDRILANAGIAKMTLYKHFRGKQNLILAALRARDERWMLWFVTRCEGPTPDPRRRLLAAFDALGEWFASRAFSGCLFIRAAAEFPQLRDPIHQLAAEHKRRLFEWIKQNVQRTGVPNADQLARQIFLLMEGAMIAAHISGSGAESAASAKAAVKSLIAAAES